MGLVRNAAKEVLMELNALRRWLHLRVFYSPKTQADFIDAFHNFYFDSHVYEDTRWLGKKCLKYPQDLWVYQELLWEVKPDLVVETGTYEGGSAFYMASLFDLMGHGRVLAIDIQAKPERPEHPRITYLVASSVAEETVQKARELARGCSRVMVILDSDHAAQHVLQELRLYAPLVSVGSYLIVEDTAVNGHPILPDHGPGPMEACEAFLKENRNFQIDRDREKFFVTQNPRGFLRRAR